MPTLDWIGKKAVVNHHRQVPFHLLKKREDLSCGDPNSGNLLVQADNLLALKALLPYYAGQVKCVVIDPPYNSGEQKWTYNDHVASPEMKNWLGATVGAEGEDLSRHDKWLCMMYPRMSLLVQFLRPDGFLFVCLDDTEVYNFKLMMEEILHPSCFITSFIWKSRRNLDNRSKHNVSIDHEYVLVYQAKSSRLKGASIDLDKYSNPDNDPRGPWMSDNLVGLATKDRRPNLHYDLINPETSLCYKCSNKGWRYSQETMAQKIAEKRIIWPKLASGRPRHKKFLSDLRSEFAGFSSLVQCGNTNEGTEEVQKILGAASFIFPKPRSLIQTLVTQATDKEDFVLDSFAGSGTTGHAVLAQNKLDNGSRRFILVEMDSNICNDITATRLKKAITGYGEEAGLDGGFSYCELGSPLFDETGQIKAEVTFHDLARHVFFTETGNPLPEKAEKNFPLLGIINGVAVYLLYNGVLKDKRPDSGNVLTVPVLHSLPTHDGPKVIYGVGCRIGATRLAQEGITFHQIPYAIKVS